MTKDTDKSEEYFSAIQTNDLIKVRHLLESGVSQLRGKAHNDNYESYPIHVAARYGRLEIVKWLVEYGADVNATGSYGETPLHTAAYEIQMNVGRFLIAHGANINALDDNDNSPLRAVSRYDCPEAVVFFRMLLEHGADENTLLDQQNRTWDPIKPVMFQEIEAWKASVEKKILLQELASKAQPPTKSAVMKI